MSATDYSNMSVEDLRAVLEELKSSLESKPSEPSLVEPIIVDERAELIPVTVGVYADKYSWSQSTQENDVEELISRFLSVFKGDITFKRNISPFQAKHERMDIYLTDFGGVADNNDSEFLSHSRAIQNLLDDRESLIVLFATNYGHEKYELMIRNELTSQVYKKRNNLEVMDFGSSVARDLERPWAKLVRINFEQRGQE